MLLKSMAILQYSESMISSNVQARQEVKNLKEKITLLQNEPKNWEQTKQDLTFEVEELRGQVKSKDQQ